jgi:hypothetical protein
MSSPLSPLADFPDKLSPMLVKELRQGMRARSFILLFLAFQTILAFMLLTVGTNMSDGAGAVASSMIFGLFGIASLMIQPMRGVNALSAEITGNTIEMMALTRLTAARIVLGKWFAIVSQTALILITIIPYLILRYFLGGMILTGELIFLSLMFLSSMALTAVTVGLSATTTKLVRALPTAGIFILLFSVPSFLMRGGGNSFMSFFALNDWPSRIAIFSYVSFIAYFGWCALSYGISTIAPVAENHSTLRRLISLALTCIAVALGFHPSVDAIVMTTVLAIILLPAAIVALTEPSTLLPPICKPFLERGPAGRLAGIFLLPGWPAGIFYTGLLVVIAASGIFASLVTKVNPNYPIEVTIVSLACLGSVLLPALLSANFTKLENKRFSTFIAFACASGILTIVPGIFANIDNNKSLLWVFIWNPPTFMMMVDERHFPPKDLLTAVIMVDSVLAFLLLATAIRAFRDYRRIFDETELSLAESALKSP